MEAKFTIGEATQFGTGFSVTVKREGWLYATVYHDTKEQAEQRARTIANAEAMKEALEDISSRYMSGETYYTNEAMADIASRTLNALNQ